MFEVPHLLDLLVQGYLGQALAYFSYMDAPEFARLSIHDGLKVKIAPVHSDFECGLRRCP